MVKLADAKPKVGRDSVKMEELFEMVRLPKNKWVQLRLLALDLLPVKRHWVNIIAGKDKREVKIPKICVSFDPATEGTKKGVKCCYDDLADGGKGELFYLGNVISRAEQEDAPAKPRRPGSEERESGFKDMTTESWTPVRVLRITSSLAKKIQGLKELNKHKLKAGVKTFDVSDERYGVDINVKHDPDAKGAEQYQVNLGDKSALTEDEKGYLVWELSEDILDKLGRETPEEAKKELKGMQIVGDDRLDEDADDEDDEDDEGIDLGSKSKGKKKAAPAPAAKGKKKAAPVDDDEDEDDDDDFDDEDEDDEPVVKSKKKVVAPPAAKGKKKVAVEEDEDDEDEDDEDEDEDDEDDEPVAKSKKKVAPPAAKGKKKVAVEEDEDEDDEDEDDEDEDDEDEDDEEDEPVVKSKKKVVAPVAKKKVVVAAPVKGKKKKAVDDDLDDDDIPF